MQDAGNQGNGHDAALRRAIEGIVRRELADMEQRLHVRIEALVDDLRSEIRALRRMDEALDARMEVTTRAVEAIEDRNRARDQIDREKIRIEARQAVTQMFSVPRVLAAFGALLVVLVSALTIAGQIGTWM